MATPKIARGSSGEVPMTYTSLPGEGSPFSDEPWRIQYSTNAARPSYNPEGWVVSGHNVSVPANVSLGTHALETDYTGSGANGGYDGGTAQYSSGTFEVVCLLAKLDLTTTNADGFYTATATPEGGIGPFTYNWTLPPQAYNVTGTGNTRTFQFYESDGVSRNISVEIVDSDTPEPCRDTATMDMRDATSTGGQKCPIGQHDDGTGQCVPDGTDPTGPQPCASGYTWNGAACVPDEPTDPITGPDGCCLPGYYRKVAGGPCIRVPQFPLDFMFAVTFTPTGAKVEVQPFNVSLNAVGKVTAQWIRDGALEVSQGMSIEFALARGSQSKVRCTLSDGTHVVARKVVVEKSPG